MEICPGLHTVNKNGKKYKFLSCNYSEPAKTMKMAKFAKLEQDVPHGKTKTTSCTKIVKVTKTVMSIFWMKNV